MKISAERLTEIVRSNQLCVAELSDEEVDWLFGELDRMLPFEKDRNGFVRGGLTLERVAGEARFLYFYPLDKNNPHSPVKVCRIPVFQTVTAAALAPFRWCIGSATVAILAEKPVGVLTIERSKDGRTCLAEFSLGEREANTGESPV